ncbi:Flagellar brake protein YcgR [compost metagenome]
MIQPQEQVIFKKVGLSEKKILFRSIATLRTPVFLRGEDEVVFQLLAVQNEKDEVLLCHHTESSKGQEVPQKVMANFAYDSERYFFQTEVSYTHGWAMLRIQGLELFQLQRRANTRVDIPEQYSAAFTISIHGGKSYFTECRLLDLSAGGMKIYFKGTPQIQSGDIIKGILRLGNRRPFEFDVVVRHVVRKEENGTETQTAGVQFSSIDNSMENRLLSMMMDLQREFFLKYPPKQ